MTTKSRWQSDKIWLGFKLLFQDWLTGTLVEEEIEELELLDISFFDESSIAELLSEGHSQSGLWSFLLHLGSIAERRRLRQVATLVIILQARLLHSPKQNNSNIVLSDQFWELLGFCRAANHIAYDQSDRVLRIGTDHPVFLHTDMIPEKYRTQITRHIESSFSADKSTKNQNTVINTGFDGALGKINSQHRSKSVQVFVSYSHKDSVFVKDLVETLSSELQNTGIRLWRDKDRIDPGNSWDEEVEEALDQCQAMLLALSTNSVTSKEVRNEYNRYLKKSKQIIPIIIETCEIPYRLDTLEHIDYTIHDYDSAIQKTANILRKLVHRPTCKT